MIAQTAAPAAPAGFPISMFAEMALIFGAFYFLLIAPQKKKQKEHEKLVATLQSGDEIVTTGGIFGTITNVKDDRFVVRVSDNAKIEIGKGFVQTVLKKQGAEEKKAS
ncbi:MAG TPA: preprotein translocase subunit YajC [Opitutaceae bacterium]|nr:preprotein translocase subunit YajC [Opitutaceae bacterium]